ncbi:MAG: hypothetical protein ACP5PT_06650 [Brevinematia bacterium]
MNYKDRVFSLLDYEKVYSIINDKIILEVGSGNGVFLEYLSLKYPENIIFGIELDIKRAKKCLKRIIRNNLNNAYIVSGEVEEVLPLFFKDKVVEKTFLNFPEPWPKIHNWRNRVFEIEVMSYIDRVSKVGAEFYLSTDVSMVFDTVNMIFTQVLGNWEFGEDLTKEYIKNFVPTLYYEKWLSEGRKFWWGVWKKVY